ncbi:prepilin-type N-terminal cleavage/methylation domain-containing protein [Lacrimispora saccharolytica]|nr:prepilin-type N-terminal cleavage/methylation domain-containing protein [Lacrimispora saccharolytica]
MLNKAIKKAKENKKGFTLAELLIVVAIIAVLVAISIPIFNSQLEKSREAVDAANIRAAYAEVASKAITGEDMTDLSAYNVTLKQTKADWQNDFDFPSNLVSTTNAAAPAAKGTVTFGWDATNQNVTVSIKLHKDATQQS